MTLEFAVRLAEIMLGVALALQSVECLRATGSEKRLGALRLGLALLLILAVYPVWIETLLIITSVILIKRFHGPYNGGSDTMTLLVLLCLWLSHLAPTRYWQEIALGYLSLQVIWSYVQSGWVKIINPHWRNGDALYQVFALSAYPVSEHVRTWADKPRLLMTMSWLVMLVELLFPLALFHQGALFIMLLLAALFHLANACLFGLNRFFWIWPAAYPIIIWFQTRLMEVVTTQ